jgi:hypothetical protein
LKYIISIVLIAIVFIACNKKEVVIYNSNNSNKSIKIKKVNNNFEKLNNNVSNEIFLDKNITTNQKIAIIYSSKKIGKYSIKISDIVLAYSTNQKRNFKYEFFDIKDESEYSITKVFNEIYEKKINNIIFYLTSNSLHNIKNYNNLEQFTIYLPLINKNDVNIILNENIIFGGINYKKQIDKLKSIATSHLVEIYDNKYRNRKLHNILSSDKNITSYILPGKYPNYKRFIQRHSMLNNASIILNLSVVKSSIFLSQLRANDDLNITQILTTQNNYTPLLFVLSQKKDTKNLILANSINKITTKLYNINKLVGNDITYDWVNYSTVLGLEYLNTKNKILFSNIEIVDNQVNYPVNLLITHNNSFISYVKEQNATIIQENNED